MPTLNSTTSECITIDGLTWTIGAPVDETGLTLLPAGTVVREPHADIKWTKMRDGERSSWSRNADPSNTQRLSENYNILESFPSWEEPKTVAEFERRLVAHCLGGARSRRINLDEVREVMREIGLDLTEYPSVGQYTDMHARPPEGTIATYQEVGTNGFSSYEFRDGKWVTTSGPYGIEQVGSSARVVHAPVQPDDPEPEDNEQEKIAAFKAAVWIKGVEAKDRYEWCSGFEKVLGSFGIDASCVDAAPTDSTRVHRVKKGATA